MTWIYVLGYLAIGYALAAVWKRLEPSSEPWELALCWLLWFPIGACVAVFTAWMGLGWLALEGFKLLGKLVR